MVGICFRQKYFLLERKHICLINENNNAYQAISAYVKEEKSKKKKQKYIEMCFYYVVQKLSIIGGGNNFQSADIHSPEIVTNHSEYHRQTK